MENLVKAFTTTLSQFFWITAPRWCYRRSVSLGAASVDGVYTYTSPFMGAACPALSVLLGLVLGYVPYGRVDLFILSKPSLITFVVVAAFGAAFGLWFLLGYAVADILFFPHPTHVIARLGLVIGYCLLAALVVAGPLMARLARVAITGLLAGSSGRMPAQIVGIVAQSIAFGLLVRGWVEAMQPLARSYYILQGVAPQDAYFVVLRQFGPTLAWVGAVLITFRALAELWLEGRPRYQAVIQELHLALATVEQRYEPRFGPAGEAIVRAIGATVLLSGLLADANQRFEAVPVLAFALALAVLYYGRVVLGRAATYTAMMNGVPPVLRFIGVLLVSHLYARFAVPSSPDSWMPVIMVVLVSVAIASLAFPAPHNRAELRQQPSVVAA